MNGTRFWMLAKSVLRQSCIKESISISIYLCSAFPTDAVSKQLHREAVYIKEKKNTETVYRRREGKSGSKPPVSKPEATVARRNSLRVRGRNLERHRAQEGEPVLIRTIPVRDGANRMRSSEC